MNIREKHLILGVILLIAVGCTLGYFRANTMTALDVEGALSDARYARDIHQWYIDNDYNREFTGSIEWHEDWVESYNDTIAVLASYKQILVLLGKTS